MEQRLLFPGCLILARFQQYELAAKAVLAKLGIEAVDMQAVACCASSIVPPFSVDWVNLPAYNLSLAERQGFDIVTLCGSCTRTLRLTQEMLARDAGLKETVNRSLAAVGLAYQGTAKVSHLIEVISSKMEEVGKSFRQKLDMRVSLSHPCNVMRPSQVMKFDDPWEPKKLREIVHATGARVVDYDQEYECCGATLLMVSEDWAIRAALAKLKSATLAGAEAMVVSCGNCFLVLKSMQDKVRKIEPGISLPVIFLPQIIGLSFGIDKKALGLEQ